LRAFEQLNPDACEFDLRREMSIAERDFRRARYQGVERTSFAAYLWSNRAPTQRLAFFANINHGGTSASSRHVNVERSIREKFE
jgi:hypothetical protein